MFLISCEVQRHRSLLKKYTYLRPLVVQEIDFNGKMEKEIPSVPHSRDSEHSRPFSPSWMTASLPSLPDLDVQLLRSADGWCGCSCRASQPPSHHRDLWPSVGYSGYIRPGATRGRPLAARMKSAVLSAFCLLSLLTLWAAGKTICFLNGREVLVQQMDFQVFHLLFVLTEMKWAPLSVLQVESFLFPLVDPLSEWLNCLRASR